MLVLLSSHQNWKKYEDFHQPADCRAPKQTPANIAKNQPSTMEVVLGELAEASSLEILTTQGLKHVENMIFALKSCVFRLMMDNKLMFPSFEVLHP